MYIYLFNVINVLLCLYHEFLITEERNKSYPLLKMIGRGNDDESMLYKNKFCISIGIYAFLIPYDMFCKLNICDLESIDSEWKMLDFQKQILYYM